MKPSDALPHPPTNFTVFTWPLREKSDFRREFLEWPAPILADWCEERGYEEISKNLREKCAWCVGLVANMLTTTYQGDGLCWSSDRDAALVCYPWMSFVRFDTVWSGHVSRSDMAEMPRIYGEGRPRIGLMAAVQNLVFVFDVWAACEFCGKQPEWVSRIRGPLRGRQKPKL